MLGDMSQAQTGSPSGPWTARVTEAGSRMGRAGPPLGKARKAWGGWRAWLHSSATVLQASGLCAHSGQNGKLHVMYVSP